MLGFLKKTEKARRSSLRNKAGHMRAFVVSFSIPVFAKQKEQIGAYPERVLICIESLQEFHDAAILPSGR